MKMSIRKEFGERLKDTILWYA